MEDFSEKPAKYIRNFMFEWKFVVKPEYREIGGYINFTGPFLNVSLYFWNLRVGWVWYDIANNRGFYLGKKHNKLTMPASKV